MSAWCCAAAKQANAAKMTSRLIFSLFGSCRNVGLEFGEGVCGAASGSPEVGWNVLLSGLGGAKDICCTWRRTGLEIST